MRAGSKFADIGVCTNKPHRHILLIYKRQNGLDALFLSHYLSYKDHLGLTPLLSGVVFFLPLILFGSIIPEKFLTT